MRGDGVPLPRREPNHPVISVKTRILSHDLHSLDLYSTSILSAVKVAASQESEGENMTRSIKTIQTGNEMFEVLESRTMMSAAPMMAAIEHAATVHQPMVQAKAKVTATPKKAVAPAPLVEPKMTDPSMKYQSFAGDPLFASGGPNINDINQGYVGDCYFLSTLSAIAKVDPTRIRQAFSTNTDGTYTVDLISGGKMHAVKVDTELPVWPDGQLAYAGLGGGNCLWVALMEKAWTEVRTNVASYASIDGGWMTEAFAALGVKNATNFFTNNPTTLLTVLAADLKAKQAVTIGINNVPSGAPLIGDHAYEVNAVNFDKTGKAISVTLRNPWGIDGAGNDGSNDGYVTVTATQLEAAYDGVVSAFA
jgi:Calpain family cysteine protease